MKQYTVVVKITLDRDYHCKVKVQAEDKEEARLKAVQQMEPGAIVRSTSVRESKRVK